MEDFQPHIAIDVEDFQSHLALDELEVVVELEELDDARELEIFVRELLCNVLLHVHKLVGLGWLRIDLNLGGLVAP